MKRKDINGKAQWRKKRNKVKHHERVQAKKRGLAGQLLQGPGGLV